MPSPSTRTTTHAVGVGQAEGGAAAGRGEAGGGGEVVAQGAGRARAAPRPGSSCRRTARPVRREGPVRSLRRGRGRGTERARSRRRRGRRRSPRPRRRRAPPRRRASPGRSGRGRRAAGSTQVAGSRSTRDTAPQPTASVTSRRRAGARGAAPGPRSRASAPRSGSRARGTDLGGGRRRAGPAGFSLSAGWSSTCAMTRRVGVSTRTVTCRRTSDVEGGLRLHEVGHHLLVGQRHVEHVRDELRVVAGPVQVGGQVITGIGRGMGHGGNHPTRLVLRSTSARQRPPRGVRPALRGPQPDRRVQHRRAVLGDHHGVQLQGRAAPAGPRP